jgi:isochorismate synthase
VLSRRYQHIAKDNPIEELAPGFIFAPFDKEKESIFLPADFLFSLQEGELKSPQTSLEINSLAWLNEQHLKPTSTPVKIHTSAYDHSKTFATEKSTFTSLVERSLRKIEEGSVEKLVPSRTKVIDLPERFDVVNVFQKLCATYPHALISFVSLPGIGSWIGASPEVLVSVEDNTIFKTVALAGTKSYTDNINLKAVAWTQKEIEEQALVERYIISCFKKIRLREYDEHGPKTVVAGNVMHLRSEFTVDMKATNFLQLGSTMLRLLHPTSAVCGMPSDLAIDFLKQHEGYDREFYAGYLGPVNIHNNISIFVNLRCAQLLGDKAMLYAGAGVTIDSNPDDEWAETEIKLNTLLKVMT